MRVTIENKVFFEKLNIASRFTSNQLTNLPSLSGCRITARKGKITICSTNLNDYFETSFKASISKEGDLIIDVKKVIDFLNFVSDPVVVLNQKDNSFIIETNKGKGVFGTYSFDDYPSLPHKGGERVVFDCDIISSLPFVLFAASRDESRPVLTGVQFQSIENEIHIVSTDGFRLSIVKLEGRKNTLPQFVLSSKLLSEIFSLTKGSKEMVLYYSPEKRTALFEVGESKIITRTIEGDFPPYEKVIPEARSVTFKVEREELLKNIKLISVFARDLSNVVICDLSKKGLVLRPKSGKKDESEVFQEVFNFKGESFRSAFNYRYILDFLNNTHGKDIEIVFNDPMSPGVFIPSPSSKNRKMLHIIMPLRTEEIE